MIGLGRLLQSMAGATPMQKVLALGITGGVAFVAVRVMAGVTVPEIPVGELRSAARTFRDLADALDGGDDPQMGAAGAARRARTTAMEGNTGPAITAFQDFFDKRVDPFPHAFAVDCRVLAKACDDYAALVDDTRRRLAEVEDLLLQLLWLVIYQPITSSVGAMTQVWATAQIARMIKIARAISASFGRQAARIFSTRVGGYAVHHANYQLADAVAYSGGSVAISAGVKATNGVPVGSASENADLFGEGFVANIGFNATYDLVRLIHGGAPSRTRNLVARMFASGIGWELGEGVYNGEDYVADSEEMPIKIVGHGLRALIFPPGWTFRS